MSSELLSEVFSYIPNGISDHGFPIDYSSSYIYGRGEYVGFCDGRLRIPTGVRDRVLYSGPVQLVRATDNSIFSNCSKAAKIAWDQFCDQLRDPEREFKMITTKVVDGFWARSKPSLYYIFIDKYGNYSLMKVSTDGKLTSTNYLLRGYHKRVNYELFNSCIDMGILPC